MKKKYQEILLDAACLTGKIPSVTFSGATATAYAYISAYRDYNEACKFLGIIATNIRLADGMEAAIKNYEKQNEDVSEMKEALKWYTEKIENAYKELKDYIAERERENWR